MVTATRNITPFFQANNSSILDTISNLAKKTAIETAKSTIYYGNTLRDHLEEDKESLQAFKKLKKEASKYDGFFSRPNAKEIKSMREDFNYGAYFRTEEGRHALDMISKATKHEARTGELSYGECVSHTVEGKNSKEMIANIDGISKAAGGIKNVPVVELANGESGDVILNRSKQAKGLLSKMNGDNKELLKELSAVDKSVMNKYTAPHEGGTKINIRSRVGDILSKQRFFSAASGRDPENLMILAHADEKEFSAVKNNPAAMKSFMDDSPERIETFKLLMDQPADQIDDFLGAHRNITGALKEGFFRPKLSTELSEKLITSPNMERIKEVSDDGRLKELLSKLPAREEALKKIADSSSGQEILSDSGIKQLTKKIEETPEDERMEVLENHTSGKEKVTSGKHTESLAEAVELAGQVAEVAAAL